MRKATLLETLKSNIIPTIICGIILALIGAYITEKIDDKKNMTFSSQQTILTNQAQTAEINRLKDDDKEQKMAIKELSNKVDNLSINVAEIKTILNRMICKEK